MLKALLQRSCVKHSVPAFAAWTAGDFLTQVVEQVSGKNKGSADLTRSASSGFYGAVLVTPVATKWYGPRFNGGLNLLSPVIRAQVVNLGRLRVSILQSGLTFLCMAPAFCVSYISWMGFFYKDDCTSDIVDSIRQKVKPILICDAMFWPAADLLNFAIVPEKYRFYVVLLEDMIWAAVLAIWGFNHDDINHVVELSKHAKTAFRKLFQEALPSEKPLLVT